jgi:hypothetical protein
MLLVNPPLQGSLPLQLAKPSLPSRETLALKAASTAASSSIVLAPLLHRWLQSSRVATTKVCWATSQVQPWSSMVLSFVKMPMKQSLAQALAGDRY